VPARCGIFHAENRKTKDAKTVLNSSFNNSIGGEVCVKERADKVY
jgi:hypothetical protein